jgi:hypothetical protein
LRIVDVPELGGQSVEELESREFALHRAFWTYQHCLGECHRQVPAAISISNEA